MLTFKFLPIMRKYLYIIAVCLLATACTKDKWFNAKQTLTQVVPVRVNDFQAMLDNVLMDWNSPYLGEVGTDDHYVPASVYTQLNTNEMNAYTFSHVHPYKRVEAWG